MGPIQAGKRQDSKGMDARPMHYLTTRCS